jgi:hypothetical protein
LAAPGAVKSERLALGGIGRQEAATTDAMAAFVALAAPTMDYFCCNAVGLLLADAVEKVEN